MDIAILHKLLVAHAVDERFVAHVKLLELEKAGSSPADEDRIMEWDHFQYVLRRRLRIKVLPTDMPCCYRIDQMDVYGDHALVCQCNGDRTKRHNGIRNLICNEPRIVGLEPEVEK